MTQRIVRPLKNARQAKLDEGSSMSDALCKITRVSSSCGVSLTALPSSVTHARRCPVWTRRFPLPSGVQGQVAMHTPAEYPSPIGLTACAESDAGSGGCSGHAPLPEPAFRWNAVALICAAWVQDPGAEVSIATCLRRHRGAKQNAPPPLDSTGPWTLWHWRTGRTGCGRPSAPGSARKIGKAEIPVLSRMIPRRAP